MKMILASSSPRRKELLQKIIQKFDIIPSEAEEITTEKKAHKAVMDLAFKKAIWVQKRNPQNWILGADTLVFYRKKALGKPQNTEEARKHLMELSGNSHQVYTGLALYNPLQKKWYLQYAKTIVHFDKLSPQEIECYIAKEEWKDAAGAYKIQGFGDILVKWIEGSYSNVVGLPLNCLYGILKAANYPLRG